MKLKILFILPYFPFPLAGGSVRVYNISRHLSKLFECHFICNYDHEEDLELINEYENISNIRIYPFKHNINYNIVNKIKSFIFNKPIFIYKNCNNEFQKELEKIISTISPSIIHVHELREATPALDVAKKYGLKKIITAHNVDFINLSRYIMAMNNPFVKLIYMKINVDLKKYELETLSQFDAIISVSEVDKKILISEGIPENKVIVVPNGVDCDYYEYKSINLEKDSILFMGLLSYGPNEIAIKNYLVNFHSIVKKDIPTVKLYILGRNAPKWLHKLSESDPSIIVTGFVEDIREYLGKVKVCIAPITVGSGTRLKILEYMAMGKPVVSTSLGAEGINVINGENIIIADGEDFGYEVINLLKNDDVARKIGQNGRELVEEQYDWKKIVEKEIEIYKGLEIE